MFTIFNIYLIGVFLYAAIVLALAIVDVKPGEVFQIDWPKFILTPFLWPVIVLAGVLTFVFIFIREVLKNVK